MILCINGSYDVGATNSMKRRSAEHASIPDSMLWQEIRRMMEYVDLLHEAYDDERAPHQLDSTEVAELIALGSGGSNDRVATWINNLLCAVYDHCTPPLTGGDGLPKSNPRQTYAQPPTGGSTGSLRIAPNPASTSTTFTYVLKHAPKDASLQLTDLAGRTVHQVRLAQREGIVTWDTQHLVAGIYVVSIRDKGRVVLSEKLIIQP